MSGLPVITTKGAPWEGLVQNNCGWWIDIGVDPMVKALDKALSLSPEKLHQMGKRGKIYAENNFGYSLITKKMIQVYKWMIEKKNKPNFIV
jgi:glycosyltransferase involved in cell wall biosynthesis